MEAGASWLWCWYRVTRRRTGWLIYYRIMFPIFGGGGSLAVVLVPGHQAVDRLAHLLRTVAVLAGLSLTVATAHYGFTVSSCIEQYGVYLESGLRNRRYASLYITVMRNRIRILIFVRVMRICGHWYTDPSGLHFEPLRLHFEHPRPSMAPILSL